MSIKHGFFRDMLKALNPKNSSIMCDALPLGDPRFRLSALESTFTWKWDTVLQNTNSPCNGHENTAFRVLFPAVGARSNLHVNVDSIDLTF